MAFILTHPGIWDGVGRAGRTGTIPTTCTEWDTRIITTAGTVPTGQATATVTGTGITAILITEAGIRTAMMRTLIITGPEPVSQAIPVVEE